MARSRRRAARRPGSRAPCAPDATTSRRRGVPRASRSASPRRVARAYAGRAPFSGDGPSRASTSGAALEQAVEQVAEPGARRAERGEPHLPVEARHVRGDERAARDAGSPGFHLKGHSLPVVAVGRDLDHDLVARRRHHREEAVVVDRAQRLDGREQRAPGARERGARARRQRPDDAADRQPQRGEGGERAAAPGGAGRTGAGFGARRREQGEHQSSSAATQRTDREQIEEAVVAGERDQEHQDGDRGRAGGADAARAEEQPGRAELDREQGEAGELLDGARQEVRPPGERRRQGLSPIMVRERGEIPPRGIAAEQLDHGRLEHQLEQQQTQQPKGAEGRLGPRSLSKRPRDEEQRDEARLQEESVPLEAHEVRADHAQRQVQRPAGERAGSGGGVEDQARRRRAPRRRRSRRGRGPRRRARRASEAPR